MRTLTNLPRALLRLVRSFVSPTRTAGRIALGRTSILLATVAALIFVGYTLTKKSIRLPLTGGPYEIEVEFSDGKGLDALDEPAAAVAGTPLGRVTDIRLENGRAVATLTFDPDVEGKIFADATAAMRPASAIQNLTVNIDPGTPALGPLPNGGSIPSSRSEGYVSVDELTKLLDADTQAYIQILLQEAERGLRGRAGELRSAILELGRLTDSAIPVARTLAERRRLLARLVGDLEVIFETTASRGTQLAEAINTANHTLEVTAGRELELSALTRELAPTLIEAERSIRAVHRLAQPLVPALEELIPAAAPLAGGLRSLRESLPLANRFVGRLDVLTTDGRRPLALFLRATRGLRANARRQIEPVRGFLKLARILDRYKKGLPQTADTLSGAISVQDRGGPYVQNDFLKFEAPRPENFGMPESLTRRNGKASSPLELAVATALERVCRQGVVAACLARLQIPGLPHRLVSLGEEGSG
jgi:phospholipid/cholesterol/gamma-HCH transport system substrate-binding protein